jgi:hypothetical protein
MTRLAFSFLLLFCVGGLAVPGCDKTTGVAPLGQAECRTLGSLCHDPGHDLGGRYDECHDIGHEGEGDACLRVYDECRVLCERASHGHAGAGGEGGSDGAGHHAGGAAH